MRVIRIFIQTIILSIITLQAPAQIGYQVSLLNSATGEPRAAETVQVNITLTNCEGKIIHTETKTATTNDFGILSLAVGNENTFKDVDWRKLPFFIEASVDGKLIGKSQVLTVPIAEHAKHTGTLTKEILCSKKWTFIDEIWGSRRYTFNTNNKCVREYIYNDETSLSNCTYLIDGNNLIVYGDKESETYVTVFYYLENTQELIDIRGGDVYK